MDWLLGRQHDIEQKLARRHLAEGAVVLYDVSSSYYEGHTCPLACYGHNRDGKKGLPIIVYGLLTDAQGRPVALDVYPGNTADPATVPDQIAKLRERFDLTRVVLVGDRGMLTQTQIDTLREYPGLGWISALRSEAIRELLEQGHVCNVRSSTGSIWPRFVRRTSRENGCIACYNPLLAEQRQQKRQRLLAATGTEPASPGGRGAAADEEAADGRGDRPQGREGALAVYKMAKHFRTADRRRPIWVVAGRDLRDPREEQLDGIYVIRTSEPETELCGGGLRPHLQESGVGRACLPLPEGLDLLVRPIRHWVDPAGARPLVLVHAGVLRRVAHAEGAPVAAVADEELEQDRRERDPVKPAEPSESAMAKRRRQHRPLVECPPQLCQLLAHLASRSRNTHRLVADPTGSTFQQLTEPDSFRPKPSGSSLCSQNPEPTVCPNPFPLQNIT